LYDGLFEEVYFLVPGANQYLVGNYCTFIWRNRLVQDAVVVEGNRERRESKVQAVMSISLIRLRLGTSLWIRVLLFTSHCGSASSRLNIAT
jgi:hypothetical protein